MAFDESSMSRSSPSCFSSGIKDDRRGEDGAAAIGVGAFLHRLAADEIDRTSKFFFEVFFQRAHFKKADARLRQKIDEKIDIASRMALTACHRTEHLDTSHRTT